MTKALQKQGTFFARGSRNYFVFEMAKGMNKYGVPFLETMFFAQNLQETDFTASEIVSTVRSAYKNLSQHNTKIWK